jgi:hypothetical protein
VHERQTEPASKAETGNVTTENSMKRKELGYFGAHQRRAVGRRGTVAKTATRSGSAMPWCAAWHGLAVEASGRRLLVWLLACSGCTCSDGCVTPDGSRPRRFRRGDAAKQGALLGRSILVRDNDEGGKGGNFWPWRKAHRR